MCKILVVDDSPELLEFFTYLFTTKGYEIETALCKTACTKVLESYTPDLILMDVNLSCSSGADLCMQLKTDRVTKSIPVILLSADPLLLLDYKECNADDFLEKPFDMSLLISKVSKYMVTA